MGINYRSIFFELHHFDVDLLIPDVMHDLLEGTLQYGAKLILKHMIGNGYVTYAKFKRILEGLELGYMEADDKPSQISLAVINSGDK